MCSSDLGGPPSPQPSWAPSGPRGHVVGHVTPPRPAAQASSQNTCSTPLPELLAPIPGGASPRAPPETNTPFQPPHTQLSSPFPAISPSAFVPFTKARAALCFVSGVSGSVPRRGLQPSRPLCPWDSPGRNAGVGCHALLQGIFPTQGANPGLPHCRRILYP